MDRIQEHMKALEIDEIDWLNKESTVEKWEEKRPMAYGGSFLSLQLDTGFVFEFSYIASQGTQYCTCKAEDEGYNALYNCCGEKCDWEVPMVIKNNSMDELEEEVFVFTGKQKELWA